VLDLGPVWLIDSENRSSLKYATSKKTGKGFPFKFVPLPSSDYSPDTYMEAQKARCLGGGGRRQPWLVGRASRGRRADQGQHTVDVVLGSSVTVPVGLEGEIVAQAPLPATVSMASAALKG
jgi:hypothetical protein